MVSSHNVVGILPWMELHKHTHEHVTDYTDKSVNDMPHHTLDSVSVVLIICKRQECTTEMDME